MPITIKPNAYRNILNRSKELSKSANEMFYKHHLIEEKIKLNNDYDPMEENEAQADIYNLQDELSEEIQTLLTQLNEVRVKLLSQIQIQRIYMRKN